MPEVSMREMLEAGVHFGHQVRYWNPRMEPYLYGRRNHIHIIDLEQTLPMYRRALKFLARLVTEQQVILFVGTKRAAQQAIEEEAARCGMPYVSRRWLGGLLTNFRTIHKSINQLQEREEMVSSGKLEGLSKKERLRHHRELEKLRRNFNGIRDMHRLPDALLVIDIGHEAIAVAEARKMNIPVIGLVDSNNDPAGTDYIIPGNDDSARAIRLYLRGAADAILEARRESAERMADTFVEIEEAPVAGAEAD